MAQDNSFKIKTDPEPFAVAALLITGCSLILQFAQTAMQFHAPPPSPLGSEANRFTMLDSLRTSATDLRSKIERVIRAIERGSDNPENEFFEARFRLNQATLFLDPPHYEQFKTALSEAFTATGGLSVWINHIQLHDAGLAYRLGSHLAEPLAGMATRLNNVLDQGRANREILEELYRATESLLNAIEAEERRGN